LETRRLTRLYNLANQEGISWPARLHNLANQEDSLLGQRGHTADQEGFLLVNV
jgi:hypothetical protein